MTLWIFQHVGCFSAPYVRNFVAPRFSLAYILHLLGLACLVLFPLFATFASDNVWVKESHYREQPMVTFSQDLLVVLSADSPAAAVGWCTREELRPLLPAEVLVPVVRAGARDANHDGVPEELGLSLEMPLLANASGYRRLFLLAVYDYELRERTAERLGGLVAVDVNTPYAATGVWLRGRVVLRQNLPLRVRKHPRTVYASSPLEVNPRSNWVARNYPVTAQALLDRYAGRNETIHLELTAPPVWDYAPAGHFTAKLVLDVPMQMVQYVPGALEVLKFAWIQLLSFVFPAWLILRRIQAFAFENQIVETYVMPELPPKGAA